MKVQISKPYELLRWHRLMLGSSESMVEQRSHAMPSRSIDQPTPRFGIGLAELGVKLVVRVKPEAPSQEIRVEMLDGSARFQ